jgi:thiol:disulfide interchange protein
MALELRRRCSFQEKLPHKGKVSIEAINTTHQETQKGADSISAPFLFVLWLASLDLCWAKGLPLRPFPLYKYKTMSDNIASSSFVRLGLFIIFNFAFGDLAHAQSEPLPFPNHSRAAVFASHSMVKPGEKFWIALHIVMDPDWHTYWKNPGDSGAAASIEMRSSQGVEFGETEWPVPRRIPTPPLMTYGYDNQVLLRAEATAPPQMSSDVLNIEWEAEWLVCKVECIPAVHSFRLDIPVGEDHTPGAHYDLITQPPFQTYPGPKIIKATYEQSGLMVSIHAENLTQSLDFFPIDTLKISTDKPVVQGGSLQLRALENLNGEVIEGLLINEATGGAQYLEASPRTGSLISFVLGAFLGGLLLNLMPCVFPIISLKIFSALKEDAKQRMSHFFFVLGALVCFSLIALLLAALKAAGHSLGWGFQLQSPLFVLILIVLFFVLGLSFLGLFDIQLPGLGFSQADHGAWGSFMTGALAVVVASPCTAPFMGAALGFALSQPITVLIAVFLSLGVGFSFPYLILALRPSLLASLPRSGPWLETFKEFMFFPMAWTALWLLWIYAQLTSISAAIWALAGISAVSGMIWWRAKGRTQKARLTGILGFLTIGALAFWQSVTTPVDTVQISSSSTTGPSWQSFQEDHLEELLSQGESVFVDFTASWCITCKVNERVTFTQPEVLDFIRAENIHMIKADWTRRDPAITKYLERFGRISVPFYLYWAAGVRQPLILPEILTPQIFINQIKEYQKREGDNT